MFFNQNFSLKVVFTFNQKKKTNDGNDFYKIYMYKKVYLGDFRWSLLPVVRPKLKNTFMFHEVLYYFGLYCSYIDHFWPCRDQSDPEVNYKTPLLLIITKSNSDLNIFINFCFLEMKNKILIAIMRTVEHFSFTGKQKLCQEEFLISRKLQ